MPTYGEAVFGTSLVGHDMTAIMPVFRPGGGECGTSGEWIPDVKTVEMASYDLPGFKFPWEVNVSRSLTVAPDGVIFAISQSQLWEVEENPTGGTYCSRTGGGVKSATSRFSFSSDGCAYLAGATYRYVVFGWSSLGGSGRTSETILYRYDRMTGATAIVPRVGGNLPVLYDWMSLHEQMWISPEGNVIYVVDASGGGVDLHTVSVDGVDSTIGHLPGSSALGRSHEYAVFVVGNEYDDIVVLGPLSGGSRSVWKGLTHTFDISASGWGANIACGVMGDGSGGATMAVYGMGSSSGGYRNHVAEYSVGSGYLLSESEIAPPAGVSISDPMRAYVAPIISKQSYGNTFFTRPVVDANGYSGGAWSYHNGSGSLIDQGSNPYAGWLHGDAGDESMAVSSMRMFPYCEATVSTVDVGGIVSRDGGDVVTMSGSFPVGEKMTIKATLGDEEKNCYGGVGRDGFVVSSDGSFITFVMPRFDEVGSADISIFYRGIPADVPPITVVEGMSARKVSSIYGQLPVKMRRRR